MKNDNSIILVVGDDVDHLYMMVRDVECNFELATASNLREAVNRLTERSFSAVLLDLGSPDSLGIDTLRRLRHDFPALPIVVTTTDADHRMGEQALGVGAQDFLVKEETDARGLTRSLQLAILRDRFESLNREAIRLHESVNSMQQVLGVVGHELRTPLAAMRASMELLMSDDLLLVEQRDVLDGYMHEEILRMAEMVNNLLEAARLNSGAAKWNWAQVNLNETVERAIRVVEPQIDRRRVALTSKVDPTDITMRGDVEAIRRLLINLLTNAAKHTSDGLIEVKIESCVLETGPGIQIQVRDSGAGIHPEIIRGLGHAFALNAGMVSDSHVKGTGLGLAICRGIVAAHGGAIAVASSAGMGSCFTVTLRADLAEAMAIKRELPILSATAA